MPAKVFEDMIMAVRSGYAWFYIDQLGSIVEKFWCYLNGTFILLWKFDATYEVKDGGMKRTKYTE